jgi:hypothetical protein
VKTPICARALCSAIALAGCAAQPPLAKPGVTHAEFDQDRLHCQALMYSDRTSHGRSAPNWLVYEQCMRARLAVRRLVVE